VLVEASVSPPQLGHVATWIEYQWLEGLFVHLHAQRRAAQAVVPESGTGRRTGEDAVQEVPGSSTPTLLLPRGAGLPAPDALEPLLMRRRSNEHMVREEMKRVELGRVLGQTGEIVTRREGGHEAVLNAVRIYCFAFKVDSVPQGLYRYDLTEHRLLGVRAGDLRAPLQALSLGQPRVAAGCCVIAMTVRWQELCHDDLGVARFLQAEVVMGQLAHRYQLLATRLGFATFLTPGVRWPEQAGVTGFPFYEEGLDYMMAIG